jgi:hypothetical protein
MLPAGVVSEKAGGRVGSYFTYYKMSNPQYVTNR